MQNEQQIETIETLIEDIDNALEILYIAKLNPKNDGWVSLDQWKEDWGKNRLTAEFDFCIWQLTRDEFIQYNERAVTYRITFSGVRHRLNGGYKQQAISDAYEASLATRNLQLVERNVFLQSEANEINASQVGVQTRMNKLTNRITNATWVLVGVGVIQAFAALYQALQPSDSTIYLIRFVVSLLN